MASTSGGPAQDIAYDPRTGEAIATLKTELLYEVRFTRNDLRHILAMVDAGRTHVRPDAYPVASSAQGIRMSHVRQVLETSGTAEQVSEYNTHCASLAKQLGSLMKSARSVDLNTTAANGADTGYSYGRQQWFTVASLIADLACKTQGAATALHGLSTIVLRSGRILEAHSTFAKVEYELYLMLSAVSHVAYMRSSGRIGFAAQTEDGRVIHVHSLAHAKTVYEPTDRLAY